MYRIGVDVGGTFTDFTVFGGPDGKVSFFKVPSTPHDPSEAIQAGLKQIIEALELDPKDISQLGHGTTVATNMIIERRGVTTGLLTTKGFRDALEVGRQVRPSLYDYSVRKPEPLVERVNRLEVDERLDSHGDVVDPLNHAQLDGAVETLAPQRREVGRHLLHALLPKPCPRGGGQGRGAAAHARRVRRACPRRCCRSSANTSACRRPCSTRMSARACRPIWISFLARVRDLGIAAEPYTIHSNGGLLSARTVAQFPVRTCLSGPAAGVVGAAVIGAAVGARELVTFDVGGTSTDVSLDQGRAAALHLQPHCRRLSGEEPDDRHPRDRRGRRQHRLDRRRRRA